MAVDAGDELNKDGIQDENRSYQDKVSEQTVGKEGEVQSLGEIINSVESFRNLKKSCEFFPNIKVESTLMSRLKSVFVARGLGEPRKDMMIMTKDVEAIVEIVRTFTDELIQDISDDFNGLVLTKEGRINEEATREQTAAFNMQHPGEEINIDAISATYFSRTNESVANKENEIVNRKVFGVKPFSMKDIDFEEIIANAFYRKNQDIDFGKEYSDDWYPEINIAIADKEIDKALVEVIGTMEERNEIITFFEDPRNAELLEELEFCLESNKYGISLNDKGRLGMIEIVEYYREQFAQDPSVLALPEAEKQAKIDELVNGRKEGILADVFERQKHITAEMANKAGIATSEELIFFAAVNLERNANNSSYDRKRLEAFVQAYPDYFKGREYNEETDSYFTREEIEAFEEKQRCSHAYKIQKARDDALEPERLSKQDKSKTIKRLLFGLRKATDKDHFDSVARADYLNALAKLSGREDIIDWENGSINEEVFYDFYSTEIDDEPVTITELADQGLKEITYEFERFLNKGLTQIEMGTWQDVDTAGVEDDFELRKRYAEAVIQNTKSKRLYIIEMEHPANYREAKNLSFISNVVVGDRVQNEKLLKKDPSLREFLNENGSLTPEAMKLYMAFFNASVLSDTNKILESDTPPETPLEKKQALELVALGLDNKTGIYNSSAYLMEKMFPEAVSHVDGELVVDEKMLLEKYNELVTTEGMGDPVSDLEELKRFQRDRLGFKYDKSLGVAFDFFRERVEREDAEPGDELLGVIALSKKEEERNKRYQEKDRKKATGKRKYNPRELKGIRPSPKEDIKRVEKATFSTKDFEPDNTTAEEIIGLLRTGEDGVERVLVNKKAIERLRARSENPPPKLKGARERAKKTLESKAKYITGNHLGRIARFSKPSLDLEEVSIKITENPKEAVSVDEPENPSDELTMVNDIFDSLNDSGNENIKGISGDIQKELERQFLEAQELAEKMRKTKREDPESYGEIVKNVQEQLVSRVKENGIDPQRFIGALRQVLADKEAGVINDNEVKKLEDSVGLQELVVLLGASKSFSPDALYRESEEADSTGGTSAATVGNTGDAGVINITELTESVGESEINVGGKVEVKPKEGGETKEENTDKKNESIDEREADMDDR